MYATVAQFHGLFDSMPNTDATTALLEELLERATQMVDRELGFSFAAYGAEATDKDVYSGNGGRYLYLPAYQSGSLESVALLSYRGTDDESETAETEYVEETRWRLFLSDGWPAKRWYRVSAIWGCGPAPVDVVQVTLEIAANLYQGRNSGGATQIGAEGGGGQPFARALTWGQRDVIARVRMQYPQESIA